MSKLHSLMPMLALALLTASPAMAQVRVRAPAAQDILTTPAECTARIAQPHQRNTCFTCVRHGGRFHLGTGACEGAAPPPPTVAIARTVAECNTIPFGPKRNRCLACISANGAYLVQGAGYGYCKHAPPPPPPPPPVDRTIQRTVEECNREIPNPEKRLRCTTCVQGGGTYYRNLGNNLGQCNQPTPSAETNVLRTVSDCTAHAKGPGRRARCMTCIQAGGTFLRIAPGGGKGECIMPAPPPPPPAPTMLRTAEECTANVPQMHQRKKCMKCVARGATYQTETRDCVAAPPAPAAEITTVEECNSRVAPGMRKNCRKCVKDSGRWDVGGNACRY